jgi:transposase
VSSPIAGHELVSVERVAALEQYLATTTAERDGLVQDCERLTRERDEYKSRAEWLRQQLERLKYEAKTPRERVDPRQIQLVFEPFAQALFGTAASSTKSDTASAGEGDSNGKKKRKTTPHGRRVLPEHLPIETIVLSPSPLPEDAVQIGTEVSWRLGYRRGGYYRLRVLRPLYVVPKEAAETSTDVKATLLGATEPPICNVADGVSVPQAESIASSAEPVASSAEPVVSSAEPVVPSAEPVVPSAEPVAPSAIPTTSETTAHTATAGDDLLNKTILYAPAPDEMIPRGLPTVDLLAHNLVSKFADKLPFNRQEGIFAREGVPITRGTMCGWAERANALAHLVVDAMEEDARKHAHVIATDATGVLVQANEKCKNGHFWVYVADRDHVIFRYSAKHSSDEPKTFFKGFRGIVLSDASNVFDILFGLPESPGEANCWSHARRYFYKAIESENRDEALTGVGFCNELFDLERQWKKLPPSQRLEMRRQRAGPVVEMLKRWKDEQLASLRVADGSRLHKALNYLTNQWAGLCKFLEDGHVPIHNNESERQLRSLVVGRANWLFVGSDETAEWTCTFVSLAASCQLHGIDPEGYLRDLFRVLPVWPKNRMLELAPKFWRATRALLDEAQLALPLGPLTVPPARPLREPVAPEQA